MEEVRKGQPPRSFEQLEEECGELTREPTGVGLDLPDWLGAVEEEIDEVRQLERSGASDEDGPIPQRQLAYEEVQASSISSSRGRLKGEKRPFCNKSARLNA